MNDVRWYWLLLQLGAIALGIWGGVQIVRAVIT